MNVKHKLETAGCKAMLEAIKVIHDNVPCSLKESKDAWDSGILMANPESPTYRTLIEELGELGVQVYNYDKIQLPKVDAVSSEQRSYT